MRNYTEWLGGTWFKWGEQIEVHKRKKLTKKIVNKLIKLITK